MKKRLSSNIWNSRTSVITFLGLLTILSYAFRSVSLSNAFGLVEAEIPLLSVPINDPNFHNFRETPDRAVSNETPVVILTNEQFFFGDLRAFTSDFHAVRNKFFIKHDDGRPNIGKLLDTMEKWNFTRLKLNIDNQGLLIFMPTAEIPAPIVIQTLAGLKKSALYQRIILASGLM